jgi:hypothetical protein
MSFNIKYCKYEPFPQDGTVELKNMLSILDENNPEIITFPGHPIFRIFNFHMGSFYKDLNIYNQSILIPKYIKESKYPNSVSCLNGMFQKYPINLGDTMFYKCKVEGSPEDVFYEVYINKSRDYICYVTREEFRSYKKYDNVCIRTMLSANEIRYSLYHPDGKDIGEFSLSVYNNDTLSFDVSIRDKNSFNKQLYETLDRIGFTQEIDPSCIGIISNGRENFKKILSNRVKYMAMKKKLLHDSLF